MNKLQALYKKQENLLIKRFNALLNGDIDKVSRISEELDKIDDFIIELEERGEM